MSSSQRTHPSLAKPAQRLALKKLTVEDAVVEMRVVIEVVSQARLVVEEAVLKKTVVAEEAGVTIMIAVQRTLIARVLVSQTKPVVKETRDKDGGRATGF